MDTSTIRINKYLANHGLAARRDIKELLKKQIVMVNGVRISEPGERVDPHKDEITINGKKLIPPILVYFMLNKPKSIISTTADERNRKNVISLIKTTERIYPIGRLDKDTTGLILLTNDGELTNQLIHPKYHVNKVYRVTINQTISHEQLRALRNGVLLEDGITAPAQVRIIQSNKNQTHLEVIIHEGRNRQIRRMCETVGIELVALQRITFGPVHLGNLKIGHFRELTKKEITQLQNASKKTIEK